ncbi:MAG: gliding motility-associated C-terminal domain-containing protein [Saprospiraceae bacterium]|nr:gliding motility-associated C-terminal domain-containing protein [Saprospiraceae bacterium]
MWFAFFVSEPTVTFSAISSNCDLPGGIQIAVYGACDGPCLFLDYGCNGGPVSTTATGLTPGIYYVVIDGCSGAICDIEFSVEPLSAIQAPPINNISPLEGPTEACPKGTVQYCLEEVPYVDKYVWTVPPGFKVNGVAGPIVVLPAPDGRCADITFAPVTGAAQICVRPESPCFVGNTQCLVVNVANIPETILPQEVLCAEDAGNYVLPWDAPINPNPGSNTYQKLFPSYYGCDSLVKINVTVLPPAITNLPAQYVCPGDCIEVGNEQFCFPGSYIMNLSTIKDCDSIIYFTVIEANLKADILPGDTLSCNDTSVTLYSAQQPGGIKVWQDSTGKNIGTGDSLVVSQPGLYYLAVRLNQFGLSCIAVDSAWVVLDSTPPVLTAFSTGSTGCGGATAQLNAVSNALNPAFQWSGPGNFSAGIPNPLTNAAGTYFVTVTSPGGCSATDTVLVLSDTLAPVVTVSADTLDCGPDPAAIHASTGNFPASFLWSGPGGFTANVADTLVYEPGLYGVTVTNLTNGCTASTLLDIPINYTPPDLTVAPPGQITCNVPLINLSAVSSTAIAYSWAGPNGFTSSLSQPTIDSPGIYTVTVVDPSGCTNSAAVTVEVDTAPPVLSVVSDTLSCAMPIGTPLAEVSSGAATFFWTGPGGFAASGPSPVVDSAGLYTVVATATNGCTAEASVELYADFDVPDIAVSAGSLSCAVQKTEINGISGTPGVQISWTGPGGFLSISPVDSVSLPGMYTATATAGNGCFASAVATVGADTTRPDIGASGDTLTCAVGTALLDGRSASPDVLFHWSGPGNFDAPVEDIFVAVPGLYTLMVTDPANGCTATTAQMIVQDTAAPPLGASAGVLTCLATAAILQGSSSVGGLQWLWTGPGGFSSNDQQAQTNAAGQYILMVTNPVNGCTNSAAVSVLEDLAEPPVNIVGGGTLTCANPVISLSGNSGSAQTNLLWTDPQGVTASTTDIGAQIPGTYVLTATGLNGCTGTTSIDISQDTVPPTVSAAGDTLDCFSGQAFLTGQSQTPGVTWWWTGPGNFSSNQQNTQTAVAGQYTLTVQAPNGCETSVTVVVGENDSLPDVALSGAATLSCLLPSLILTATISSNASGQWSTGETTTELTVSTPGTYAFTAQGPNGCINTASVVIVQDAAPPQNVMASGGTLDCNTPVTFLNGSADSPNATWNWTGPGGFSSSVQNPTDVTAPGLYTLTVVNNGNGCSAGTTIFVTADFTPPDVSATADTLTCVVSQVQILTATASGNLAYRWVGPAGFQSVEESPWVGHPGSYTVVATASNGCTETFSLEVEQNIDPPGAIAAGDTLRCDSPTGTLVGSSPTAGIVYGWSGPGSFQTAEQNPGVMQPGVYTLTVTGPNGCTSIAQATVLSDSIPPTVSANGGTLTCERPSVIVNVVVSGAAGLIWSGPGNFQSTLPAPTVSLPGTYTVLASGGNGCTATATAMVMIDTTAPVFSIASPEVIDCNTDQVTLSASVQSPQQYTVQWSTTSGHFTGGVNNLQAGADQPGTYMLQVTNLVNGCSASKSIQVLQNPDIPLALLLKYQHITCFGYKDGLIAVDAVTGGTPPLLFSLDGSAFGPSASFTNLAPGAHTVRLLDAAGCELEATAVLQEPNPLLVSLGPDTLIELGYGITLPVLSAVNEPQRVVDFSTRPFVVQADTLVYPLQSFLYNLWVRDDNNCAATDERFIRVSRNRHVYIPNVFLPDKNGVNDVLTVYGGPDVRQVKAFRVYNRWGALVFEALSFAPNDESMGWDGRENGVPAGPGVFVYYAEIEFIDGETEVFKGDVSIVR